MDEFATNIVVRNDPNHDVYFATGASSDFIKEHNRKDDKECIFVIKLRGIHYTIVARYSKKNKFNDCLWQISPLEAGKMEYFMSPFDRRLSMEEFYDRILKEYPEDYLWLLFNQNIAKEYLAGEIK